MKILFTGGGSGGHFYPIVAVAEELNAIVKENHLLKPELFYMSTEPYNAGLLFENGIIFKHVTAGKMRRAMTPQNIILNFIDLFKIFFGTLGALWTVFRIYPDVVFNKGAYPSFPALFAARLLNIPVVIHESDTEPGRVNAWAGRFAKKIAVSYPDSVKFFKPSKNPEKDGQRVAYTGNPIRKELMDPLSVGAHEFLHLEPNVPTIFITGGSQGARFINEVIMDALPTLVSRYQIIHQVGKQNITVIRETAAVILQTSEHKDRYKPFDYLNLLSMRMSAGAADVIVSRAGSTIFEIASWGKPSIIIPIPEATSHDQRTNAYAYARSGGCEVIEEKNLTPHVLISEIDRLIQNPAEREKMSAAAKNFSRRDAAHLIAEQILAIALSHEK
jgi:UDP-N-acetylglucosamine--N-acetylmuramyl-(pentapeptide) pyrophosphoryl-undecaprenol N-acetylglucosamine transferase